MSVPLENIVTQYIHAYNAMDVEGMVKHLADTIVFQNRSGGVVTHETRGIKAFKEQASSALSYFETRNQTITSLHTSDSVVTAQIAFRAVVKDDLPNGLKRGDLLELAGTSTFVFDGELIVTIVDES